MRAGWLKVSCMVLGGMGWMVGFMTGSSSGVSIVPLFVSSLPILARRSLSRISKDMMRDHKSIS